MRFFYFHPLVSALQSSSHQGIEALEVKATPPNHAHEARKVLDQIQQIVKSIDSEHEPSNQILAAINAGLVDFRDNRFDKAVMRSDVAKVKVFWMKNRHLQQEFLCQKLNEEIPACDLTLFQSQLTALQEADFLTVGDITRFEQAQKLNFQSISKVYDEKIGAFMKIMNHLQLHIVRYCAMLGLMLLTVAWILHAMLHLRLAALITAGVGGVSLIIAILLYLFSP